MSALPFIGVDVAALVDRFLILGRAAIVGPHGVGKSTLLRSIGDALRARGLPTTAVTLPGSAPRDVRIAALLSVAAAPAETVVLLDGYEQLTWPERRRARRPRLLITTHRRTRLPTLLTLRPTTAMLDTVLRSLGVAPSADAHAAFARHRGDVRETLMSLYDAWADAENP